LIPTWATLRSDVIMPVLGATAGFIAARYAGNMLAMRDLGTSDPKVAKTIAAGVGIPAVYMMARRYPMIARNSGALVLGMGMAAAESWYRDMPLLGGSPAAAAITEPSGNGPTVLTAGPVPIPEADAPGETAVVEGTGSYYDYPTNRYGQAALSDYYSGSMLGNVEAISTVTPTDVAMRATSFPQVRRVTEPFASRGDRGHAGGIFARTLYSGMLN
jgi:hypothetical protein